MKELLIAAALALLGLIGMSLWKRREAEASGGRKAQQDREVQTAKAIEDERRELMLKDAARLQRRLDQEAAEIEARAKADAETTTPAAAPQSAEETLEQARAEKARRDAVQ